MWDPQPKYQFLIGMLFTLGLMVLLRLLGL